MKITDLEESQSKEGLKTNIVDNEVSEDCAELLRELPDEMADLWHKSDLLVRKQGKVIVFIEFIKLDEYLYVGTRQCEMNVKQGADTEDQIELMKGEIRMSQKDGMVLNLLASYCNRCSYFMIDS